LYSCQKSAAINVPLQHIKPASIVKTDRSTGSRLIERMMSDPK
jgi:hypothetical protein